MIVDEEESELNARGEGEKTVRQPGEKLENLGTRHQYLVPHSYSVDILLRYYCVDFHFQML